MDEGGYYNQLDISSRDQKAFNSMTDARSNDPYEAWRWNGIRPVTRNKLISLAAHATAQLIYPGAFAQNENDQEDKDAAQVMEDLIEYHIRNSDYELSFLYGIISMLVNPVAYMSPEFSEAMQTIKEVNESGKVVFKEVMDGIVSGFQVNVIPHDEMLIANPYEYYHQRQRFTIRKKFIDYDEAKALFGEHKNFQYVRPGVKVLYDTGSNMFYDQFDTEEKTLVECVYYRNRREDMEIPFLNGVYMGDDNVDKNLMKHRDAENRPKYPEAKSGFEPIDEKRFYFYKSAASKFAPDAMLANDLWQLRMDNTLLDGQPPAFVSGGTKFNSSVRMPRAVTTVGKDFDVKYIQSGSNGGQLDSAMDRLDASIAESSADRLSGGTATESGPPKTAREAMIAQSNAQITQGIFRKMIGQLVKDFGELMMEDIIMHQTVAEVEELTGEETKVKYKTFLMSSSQNRNQVSKQIIFKPDMMKQEFTRPEGEDIGDQEMAYSDKLHIKEGVGEKDTKQRIYHVNPEVFRKLKYKIIIAPEKMNPLSEELKQALNLEAYDKLIMNPLIAGNPENLEAVTRDFLLESVAKGKADKYLKKPQPQAMGQMGGMAAPGQQGTPISQQITGNQSATKMLQPVM